MLGAGATQLNNGGLEVKTPKGQRWTEPVAELESLEDLKARGRKLFQAVRPETANLVIVVAGWVAVVVVALLLLVALGLFGVVALGSLLLVGLGTPADEVAKVVEALWLVIGLGAGSAGAGAVWIVSRIRRGKRQK